VDAVKQKILEQVDEVLDDAPYSAAVFGTPDGTAARLHG
jgi:hypothetical protein